jgi:hypothetical protein
MGASGAKQSLTDVQRSQGVPVQLVACTAEQLPMPSHVRAGVAMLLLHDAGTHVVPAA